MTITEAKAIIYANVVHACEKAGFTPQTTRLVQDACDTIIALADRKTEPNNSEKPNNCENCKHHFGKDYYDIECEAKAFGNECKFEPKDEPQTDPLPKAINGVNISDAVAWADKWLEDNPVSEMWDMIRTLRDATEWQDEPQTNADQHVQHVGSVESVEPTWTKEEHEAFYTFLWNVINPNEMQDYIEMFETKDEPQTEEWYTYQDEQEYNDRWQTERSE